MAHRIQAVAVKQDFVVEAVFFDGEVKQYDMKQLFHLFPQFLELERRKKLFEQVVVDAGGYGISWNDDLDLDAETIWEDGILIETQRQSDMHHLLAYHMAMAREKAHLTQKELAERTGIYQADISKIERGIGNPSVGTLKRLADGMDMDLHIDFIVRKMNKEDE